MSSRSLLPALLFGGTVFSLTVQAAGVSKGGEPLCVGSASFVVRSFAGGPSASELLTELARTRHALTEAWLARPQPAEWNPRCEVVIHATQTGYLSAVGAGGVSTSGSSLVQFDGSRIVNRRIDLLLDRRGELSALAHELTHVVLADKFAGRQPPRWLDEGIALLSDSSRKQSLHQKDCRTALRSGTALRLVEVLALDEFTSARQVAPFYGQSHSLVQFLAARGNRTDLLEFADAAIDQGYDQALTQHYSLAGVAELEKLWTIYATSPPGQSQGERLGLTSTHN